MLVRGSFFRQTSTITFHCYYVTFTGCGRRSESTTRLPFSCIGVCTDLLRRTCLEHQGPAVETATTVMVVGHVSRPDVEALHCRRPCFPDRRCTSLEHSVVRRSLIQFFIYIQASAEDWAFLAKLPLLNFVNIRYIVKWPRSFGLCHPNLIRSIYLFYYFILGLQQMGVGLHNYKIMSLG